MTTATFISDIPLDLARAAHAGTSHFPEDRAASERAEYAATLAADYAELARFADTDEKRAALAEEFARYREGYRRHYTAYLGSRSRCLSTMITGASNFPVARQAKRNAIADARLTRLIEFRAAALKAIHKVLRPELRPIMAGDDDAVTRLQKKIDDAEKRQEMMRAVNATIRRHAKHGEAAQITALAAEFQCSEETAKKLITPDFCGRIGFADYQLTNNSAEIRRLKARLAKISKAKTAETTGRTGEHARLEDDPAANRIRLFFPGKPDADVRERLKAAGFRWTPSMGCWQAYRNNHTIEIAEREAGE